MSGSEKPRAARSVDAGATSVHEGVPDDAAGASSQSAKEMPPDFGESLRTYALAELRRARQCLSWRQSWLHRGVHQGRKSLRRVRSTLALAIAALGRSGELVDAELRRITRSMSDLRDGQALVEAIDRLAATERAADQAGPDPGRRADLLRRARNAAIRRRAELGRHAHAACDRTADDATVMRMLFAGLKSLPWSAVREVDVLHALAGSERRVASAGRRAIDSDGDDEDWHRWRRRARRLSQQHRALDKSPLAARVAGDAGKKLAVRLGEVQDFSLLADHCGGHSPFAEDDRRLLRELAEHEVDRLRAKLHDAVPPKDD